MDSLFVEAVRLANANDGFLNILLFLATLGVGWLSGAFSAIRSKPDFKITTIPGPTIIAVVATSIGTGDKATCRTAISLYLAIVNVGRAASDTGRMRIAYRCNALKWQDARWWGRCDHHEHYIERFRLLYRWLWIEHMAVALDDFMVSLGNEKKKLYPFLVQGSQLQPTAQSRYLRVGQGDAGIVYYESPEYWGGYSPRVDDGKCDVRVEVKDAFGRTHRAKFKVPVIPIEEARKFTPSFGSSLESLRDDEVPDVGSSV